MWWVYRGTRSESKSPQAQKHLSSLLERIPIVLLFIVPLISLAYLVLWNNLDPIRTFLVNLVGLLAGGIVFCHSRNAQGQEGLYWARGIQATWGHLCGRCDYAFLHAPLLVGPCVLLGAIAHILQKSLRRPKAYLVCLVKPCPILPSIRRNVRLDFAHEVFFTRDAFCEDNSTLSDLLINEQAGKRTKVMVYLDEGILDGNPNLPGLVQEYFQKHSSSLNLVCPPSFVRGGEEAKNDWELVETIWSNLNQHGMCRHSYIIVVGGGAALDLVGFAASTAHRGVRLVRLPTTTLSQGDGGVGVKNGINFFGKKNWVGTFAVPDAVINDFSFL